MSRSISRRSFLKAAGVGAAALGLAACGGSSSSSTAASAPASSAAASTASGSGKPYEGVVLHYAATDTEATGNEMQDIVKMVKEKTGMGQQDLDTTMKNIFSRSNEAIKEAELY